MEHKNLTFWERITLYWKFEYQYYPRNFIHGVKNLIKWFPIIWKDRNWDDSFFWTIVKFKITKMSKSHGAYMPYVGNKRNVEIMNLIVRLIDKFQDETYLHEYFDYVDEKIWFEKVEGAGYYNMKSEILKDDLDEYFQKYPLLKKQAEQHRFYKQNPYRATLAISMGFIQHERAKRLIFELLNRHVDKWWE
jgi:hypothetical protein